MTDSTVMTTDLDLLAERVERAASLVARLREEKQTLTGERDELSRRLDEMRDQLQGQDATALRDWSRTWAGMAGMSAACSARGRTASG